MPSAFPIDFHVFMCTLECCDEVDSVSFVDALNAKIVDDEGESERESGVFP